MQKLFGPSVVAVVLLLGAEPAIADGRYYNNEDTIEVSLPNWMEWIPDGTPISELAIPGTHDSASLDGGDLVETQDLSLRAQLDAGIRAFDIRARHIENVFAIHHDQPTGGVLRNS